MGVIEKVRKICFKFLWSGNSEFSSGFPWTSWKVLKTPKYLGGWGLKVSALFAKALAAKSVWNIIHELGLWVKIAIHKYIRPLSLLEWIRVNERRKEVYLFVGNLYFGILILLVISLFGR